MYRGTWQATVHGVTKGGPWLSTHIQQNTKKIQSTVWMPRLLLPALLCSSPTPWWLSGPLTPTSKISPFLTCGLTGIKSLTWPGSNSSFSVECDSSCGPYTSISLWETRSLDRSQEPKTVGAGSTIPKCVTGSDSVWGCLHGFCWGTSFSRCWMGHCPSAKRNGQEKRRLWVFLSLPFISWGFADGLCKEQLGGHQQSLLYSPTAQESFRKEGLIHLTGLSTPTCWGAGRLRVREHGMNSGGRMLYISPSALTSWRRKRQL